MKSFARVCAASLLLAVSAAPALAESPCGETAQDEWISVAQIATMAGQMGYDVQSVDRAEGCYLVRARSEAGEVLTLLMHPVSGEIVEERR